MHSLSFLPKALCFVQVILLSQAGTSLSAIGPQRVDERRFFDGTSWNLPATRGSSIKPKDAPESTDYPSSNIQTRAAGTFWLGDDAFDHGIVGSPAKRLWSKAHASRCHSPSLDISSLEISRTPSTVQKEMGLLTILMRLIVRSLMGIDAARVAAQVRPKVH